MKGKARAVDDMFNTNHAVVRGLVEHGDAGHYFGSTASLRVFMMGAQIKGYVDQDGKLTEAGREFWRIEIAPYHLRECRWIDWRRKPPARIKSTD